MSNRPAFRLYLLAAKDTAKRIPPTIGAKPEAFVSKQYFLSSCLQTLSPEPCTLRPKPRTQNLLATLQHIPYICRFKNHHRHGIIRTGNSP